MRKLILILIVFAITTRAGFSEVKTFIIDDPKDRNFVEFTSKAPIENIIGTTNNITGKVTFDPADLTVKAKAKIQVDLASISTGIKMRDEHMKGEPYLHTDKFPTATFVLQDVVSVDSKQMDPSKKIGMTLKGDFTIHGVSKEITVKGVASFYDATPQMASQGFPGDILNFDGSFTIMLSDFNIKRPEMLVMRLSEDQAIRLNFTATTGR